MNSEHQSTTTTRTDRVTIEVHGVIDEAAARTKLRGMLCGPTRSIPSMYFYDDRGSALFEQICELPEYYPTRTEARILTAMADRVVAASGAEELVELGSGAATKTRILLDAMARAGQLRTYVPVDVSEGIVRRVADELVEEYPQLVVHGVITDFMLHLGKLPEGGRRLVAFLGGTIGNLDPMTEAVSFLRQVRAGMDEEDRLLLGCDLIKDPAVIEAAYNDSAGVTADFNLNALRVLNDRYNADFDPAAFRHRAFYHREHRWIEMRLQALTSQTVRIDDLDVTIELAAGEEILTEISTKYDRPRLEALYAAGGFVLEEWMTDPDELFALSLARPAG